MFPLRTELRFLTRINLLRRRFNRQPEAALRPNTQHVHAIKLGLNWHYDLLNDFVPVALLSTAPSMLVANKMMPANDLKGLIARLKANPDKAVPGHGGNGSLPHVASALIRNETGTRFQFVPYRGPPRQSRTWWQVRFTWRSSIRSSPCRRCVPAPSRPTASPQRPRCSPRLTSRRWTRRDCPGSTSRNGMGFGYPRARRRISCQSQWRSDGGRGRPEGAGAARRPRAGIFPPDPQTPEGLGAFQKAEIEKPRSRSGGRSSRKLESKRNDWSAGYPINRVPQDNDRLLRCIILSGRESAVGHSLHIVARRKLPHVRNAPKATVGRQSVARRDGPVPDMASIQRAWNLS